MGCFQPFEPDQLAIAPRISSHAGLLYHSRCLPAHLVGSGWRGALMQLVLHILGEHRGARPEPSAERAPRKGRH